MEVHADIRESVVNGGLAMVACQAVCSTVPFTLMHQGGSGDFLRFVCKEEFVKWLS